MCVSFLIKCDEHSVRYAVESAPLSEASNAVVSQMARGQHTLTCSNESSLGSRDTGEQPNDSRPSAEGSVPFHGWKLASSCLVWIPHASFGRSTGQASQIVNIFGTTSITQITLEVGKMDAFLDLGIPLFDVSRMEDDSLCKL